ncbi:hypothetical protein [Klebsiella phage phiKp_21]|nr:hypothetical protein [Klebsiella phage phiKp_21]
MNKEKTQRTIDYIEKLIIDDLYMGNIIPHNGSFLHDITYEILKPFMDYLYVKYTGKLCLINSLNTCSYITSVEIRVVVGIVFLTNSENSYKMKDITII